MVIEKFCVVVFAVWKVRYAPCTASQLAQAHYGAVELDLAGAFISDRKRA